MSMGLFLLFPPSHVSSFSSLPAPRRSLLSPLVGSNSTPSWWHRALRRHGSILTKVNAMDRWSGLWIDGVDCWHVVGDEPGEEGCFIAVGAGEVFALSIASSPQYSSLTRRALGAWACHTGSHLMGPMDWWLRWSRWPWWMEPSDRCREVMVTTCSISLLSISV